jgi:hypothetical protein
VCSREEKKRGRLKVEKDRGRVTYPTSFVNLQHPIIIIIIIIIIIMRLSEAAVFSWAWTNVVVLPAMVAGGSTSSHHHLRSLQDGRIVGVRHFGSSAVFLESPTIQ